MAYNYEYPYTDPGRFNADWILSQIKQLENDLKNFVGLNTIKYADPILWDITSQYEANTVVIDGQTGNAYISLQPVPVGVALNNSDYWTQIYNYADELDRLREQIAFNEKQSPTATRNYIVGELIFLNGTLYKAISAINAGDAFVNGSNVITTSINDEIIGYDGRITTAENNITALQNDMGDINNLTTSDKTSIVNAINELDADIGDLASLTTGDKTSIVNAINEVDDLTSVLDGLSIYNVKHYGARGDGVANDTNAFKAVATLINANGGVMYVPKGTYKINDTINIKHVGARLVGDNQQATYVIMTDNKPAFVFGDGLTPTINIKVEDLGIISTGAAQDNTCIGLHLNYCVNSLVNNVVVQNFKVGIQFTHTGNSFLTNCGVVSSLDYSVAYYMTDQSVSISLNNDYASFSGLAADTGIGLELSNGDIADINVNYLDIGNGAYGVDINGSTSPSDYPPTDIRLHEIVSDGARLACIHITDINERGSVYIEGGWLNPLANGTSKCVDLSSAYNISICGVTMQQLADSAPIVFGISANAARFLIINGCKFINLVAAVLVEGSSNLNVTGNTVMLYSGKSSASPAILLANSSYNSIINSNTVIGIYAKGVEWASGDNGVIVGNVFRNVTSPLTSVTITNKQVANNIT